MGEKWGNEGSQRLLVNETSYVVQANTEGLKDRWAEFIIPSSDLYMKRLQLFMTQVLVSKSQ